VAGLPGSDGQLMLIQIPAYQIDAAWKNGASDLAKACDTSGGEITGDQLKMILARGERTLVRMESEGQVVGWGVVRIDQLPNLRALYVTDMVAPGAHFETFFEDLKQLAAQNGCSVIRCAAKPAQERLYRMKCQFRPVYTILEVTVE
jgi:hypothetical protein